MTAQRARPESQHEQTLKNVRLWKTEKKKRKETLTVSHGVLPRHSRHDVCVLAVFSSCGLKRAGRKSSARQVAFIGASCVTGK